MPSDYQVKTEAFEGPLGGFSIVLERVTAKLLGLENVKQAALFPCKLNRIDSLLSHGE